MAETKYKQLTSLLRFFLGIFAKSDIYQQEAYNKQGTSYLRISRNFQDIHCSKISSILTTNNKNIIPKNISLVNIKSVSKEEILEKLGVMKATPNHPADRFINNPESALSQGLVNNIPINL